jgi:lipoprotein NlpD
VADNVTERGRAKNRRVELELVGTQLQQAPKISNLLEVPTSARRVDGIDWSWPTIPHHVSQFGPSSTGIAVRGIEGQGIHASADGHVVFAGDLKDYGKLVILQHQNGYQTAYAFNKVLLVKEDQVVRRGQKIAEMGSSDAGTALHLEIRKGGWPLNPLEYLPQR